MGRTLATPSHQHLNNRIFTWFEDFAWYITPHLWTSLASDGGTSVAIVTGDNGLLGLTTGATDNNEAAVRTTNKLFTIADGKTLVGEALLQYSEAATDDANVAFGFSSVIGADQLLDDGAGPATNFSGALIYKVDGGTVWKVVSSKGTTQTISTSTKTAGGTTQQKLTITITPTTSTIAEVTYLVDDVPLYDAAIVNRQQPIKHYITYASAVAMYVGAYVKAGGATSEVLNIDWISWEKVR